MDVNNFGLIIIMSELLKHYQDTISVAAILIVKRINKNHVVQYRLTSRLFLFLKICLPYLRTLDTYR